MEVNYMRTLSSRGRDHIKQWEQLQLYAYLPTQNDRWTIGWGHTHTAVAGMLITVEQAEALLSQDLEWAEREVSNRVKVYLSQNQYDALVSFVFNIGVTQFRTSTLLEVLNDEKYEQVPGQLARWNKQTKQNGNAEEVRGLTRRRAAEAALWGGYEEEEFAYGSPAPPQGRKGTTILKESKTAKAGFSLAGIGGVNLLAEVGEFQGVMDIMQGASPYVLVGLGGWFVYNRWLDSKKGKAV
jgi:lysozyme